MLLANQSSHFHLRIAGIADLYRPRHFDESLHELIENSGLNKNATRAQTDFSLQVKTKSIASRACRVSNSYLNTMLSQQLKQQNRTSAAQSCFKLRKELKANW